MMVWKYPTESWPGGPSTSLRRTRGDVLRPERQAPGEHQRRHPQPGNTAPPRDYRRTVRADSRAGLRNVVYGLGQAHAGRAIHAIIGDTAVAFWDATTGEIITEHPIPRAGVKHVGFVGYNRKFPGFTPANPDNEVAPMP
jgi:hypothetical protein